eukprot:11906360-Ditylum_brightwellii.AAC.1
MAKPQNMPLHIFVACVNKINNGLEQFLPRDNGTPQVKLADNELMDILKNAVPKSLQKEMCRQHFDCMAEDQAKFIGFCENLELLDLPKKAQTCFT